MQKQSVLSCLQVCAKVDKVFAIIPQKYCPKQFLLKYLYIMVAYYFINVGFNSVTE